MDKLNLMLHCGASQTTIERVEATPTPEAVDTWHPIPHGTLISQVRDSLERSGFNSVQEAHAVAKDGARYFGLMQLANGKSHDDYSLVVGLRNSHDKRFTAGLVVGSGVFVCDNLAFSGEIVIGRKHTRYIMRDLPQLIESAIGKLSDARTSQDQRIDAYKNTGLNDTQAHDLLIQSLDSRVVPVTKLPKVLEEWRNPSHPEFAEGKNAWRLMNAYTEVLKDSALFNKPRATQALHGLLDTTCGLVSQN